MIPEILDIVSNNPGISATAATVAIATSEALGFTKKGGILKLILSILIFLGRTAKDIQDKSIREAAAKRTADQADVEEHG